MSEEIVLTPRQEEVLYLMADGHTTKQIAYQLGIGQRVVLFHISELRRKLDAETRSHAVHKAHQKGLLR